MADAEPSSEGAIAAPSPPFPQTPSSPGEPSNPIPDALPPGEASTNSAVSVSPKATIPKPTTPKPRPRPSSADVGMVPVSHGAANDSRAIASSSPAAPAIASPTEEPRLTPAPPPAKVLSPQDRNNNKLQQRLEQAVASAIPAETPAPPQGFIASVRPDGNGKGLTLILEPNWYQLEAEQQEAIAATLWGQRNDLNFQQLTLEDAQGKTIARNPVVGDQMVILRR